jgi:ComF family protein
MKTSFWTKLFDLFAPRRCAGCGRRLSAEESVFCAVCQLHVPLTHFSHDVYDNPMARLFWGLLPTERAAALFYYEPNTEVAHLLHAIKYFDRPDLAEAMGCLVAERLTTVGFFEGIDGIVPVPLSADRCRQRGYNQCELIAQGVSRVTGLPIYNNVLVRTTFQGSQTHLNAFERRENVSHSFVLTDAADLSDRHLLLLDDVVTTGSTLLACGQQLRQISGVRLSFLTLGFTKS